VSSLSSWLSDSSNDDMVFNKYEDFWRLIVGIPNTSETETLHHALPQLIASFLIGWREAACQNELYNTYPQLYLCLLEGMEPNCLGGPSNVALNDKYLVNLKRN